MKHKNIYTMSVLALLMTGCSTSNPFGIGYDSSVCTDSKSFGACGSPSNIYKYRDKLKDVQNDYLAARLDTTLYFGVNDEGVVQVKADRDASWDRYDTSEWYDLIQERKKEFQDEADAKEKASMEKHSKDSIKVADAWTGNVYSDLPVTKGDDLSVKYQKQGPLLVTRTKIGDIIRDQGQIQQIFVSNYVDNDGDLISSHEAMIVIRDPDWIVGEKTPKNTKLENFPTPMSENIINIDKSVNMERKEIVDSYNKNSSEGYIMANEHFKKDSIDADTNIINNFIK